ncbi:MAG: hypothetical protein Fur0010_28760 [Bdellovibrio sp.]
MKEIPAGLKPYKKTGIFDQDSIPNALLNDHSTKPDVWGKIIVVEGQLLYSIPKNNEEQILTPEKFGVVEPEVKHKVKPLGQVKFYVEFYH